MHRKILRYFVYDHLPEHLAAISRPFGELAQEIAARPAVDDDEIAACLRALLIAKDAAVRAMVEPK